MVLLALAPALAAAQPTLAPASQAPVSDPTIDQDRIDRQDPAVPTAPNPVPLPAGPVSIDEPVQASDGSEVRLTRVRFEGSTLAPEALARAVSPYAGQSLTKTTLQKLANAVTALYAKSDIAFYGVSVPQQNVTGGVLMLRVVEGRIATYAIDKKTRSTPDRLIDAQLQPLLRDKPTHKSRIERTLSLLRDVPGQKVQAALKPTDKPGELALDLGVERKQVEVTLNVNNRGVTNVVSGVQAQVGVALNGVLREGDTTRFSAYLPTQPSRYQFYTASHVTPVGANGTRLAISGAYVRTKTREPEVVGRAKQAGITLSHPLIRSYKRNLTLSASLDGINSDNYYLDTAFGGFKTRAVRMAASWSDVGKSGGYALSTSLSQGLDALGAKPREGYSETKFRKVNVQAVAVKQVAKDVAVKIGLRGQYTRDWLPTTERFALGGEGAGIAYRLGVQTADKGAAGDVELSYKVLGSEKSRRTLTVFSYADGALARSYARPDYALAARNYSLATMGGGLRVSPGAGWSATAQIAVPVKSISSDESKKARFFFSITRNI